jgi:hypothetical protein
MIHLEINALNDYKNDQFINYKKNLSIQTIMIGIQSLSSTQKNDNNNNGFRMLRRKAHRENCSYERIQDGEDYNSGKWTILEHMNFLIGVTKFSNNWSETQNLIKTRSSAQARSHSQKFLAKLSETEIEGVSKKIDFSSVKILHQELTKLCGKKLFKTLCLMVKLYFGEGSLNETILNELKNLIQIHLKEEESVKKASPKIQLSNFKIENAVINNFEQFCLESRFQSQPLIPMLEIKPIISESKEKFENLKNEIIEYDSRKCSSTEIFSESESGISPCSSFSGNEDSNNAEDYYFTFSPLLKQPVSSVKNQSSTSIPQKNYFNFEFFNQKNY